MREGRRRFTGQEKLGIVEEGRQAGLGRRGPAVAWGDTESDFGALGGLFSLERLVFQA